MNDNIIFIIPARAGSKGFPHKNRKLISYTIAEIKKADTASPIYITTDDDVIKKYALQYNSCNDRELNIIDRPKELSQDGTSMKDVLLHAIGEIKPSDDTLMVVLYPTYPGRTSADIGHAIEFMEENNGNSLLCQKKHKGVSPYLLMFEDSVGYTGKQVIAEHNLYRRQDYKPVFEISHFIIAMYPWKLQYLNDNLYNLTTLFMPIEDTIDVDTEEDWNNFIKLRNSEYCCT